MSRGRSSRRSVPRAPPRRPRRRPRSAAKSGERSRGHDLELSRIELLRSQAHAGDGVVEVGFEAIDANPLAPALDMRRDRRAHARPSDRSSCSMVIVAVDFPFVPTTWIAGYASLRVAELRKQFAHALEPEAVARPGRERSRATRRLSRRNCTRVSSVLGHPEAGAGAGRVVHACPRWERGREARPRSPIADCAWLRRPPDHVARRARTCDQR